MDNHPNYDKISCQGGYCTTTERPGEQDNIPNSQAPNHPGAANCVGGYCAPAGNAGQEVHNPEKVEAKKTEPGRTYVPSVDIIDNADETAVILDMPGVQDSDVELTLEKNILTIEATPAEQTCEGKDLVYSEYGVGEFKRSFSLTDDIDKDNISATLKDGVLTVKMKKVAPVTRKISVGS